MDKNIERVNKTNEQLTRKKITKMNHKKQFKEAFNYSIKKLIKNVIVILAIIITLVFFCILTYSILDMQNRVAQFL